MLLFLFLFLHSARVAADPDQGRQSLVHDFRFTFTVTTIHTSYKGSHYEHTNKNKLVDPPVIPISFQKEKGEGCVRPHSQITCTPSFKQPSKSLCFQCLQQTIPSPSIIQSISLRSDRLIQHPRAYNVHRLQHGGSK